MKSEYILKRHQFGWLVCAPENETGISIPAFQEATDFFSATMECPVFASGIAHHYNAFDFELHGGNRVVLAVTEERHLLEWKEEIRKSLAALPLQQQWWFGTDTGQSSETIFSVLAEEGRHKYGSLRKGCSTPLDSSDFGRCLRLVNLLNWRNRLDEVAKAFPQSKWPKIVARWDELVNATSENQNAILKEINYEKENAN